jgi:hypothetical protein
MARIPDEALERLKREVSLTRLIEAQGLKLIVQGKDLACRITNYKTRAAFYETTQRFVIAFGTLFTLLTAIGLTMSLVRFCGRIRMAYK